MTTHEKLSKVTSNIQHIENKLSAGKSLTLHEIAFLNAMLYCYKKLYPIDHFYSEKRPGQFTTRLI